MTAPPAPFLPGLRGEFATRWDAHLNPPYMAHVRDWKQSDCQDPDRMPSPEITPRWNRDPGTRCRSCAACRPEQRIRLDLDWDYDLYIAGRGGGKTRSAAETVCEVAARNKRHRIGVIAPTFADARDVCIEGESGVISVLDRWGWQVDTDYQWNRSIGEMRFHRTGTLIKLFSAEKPARLRGPQHHFLWVEEFAQVVLRAESTWDMAKFGLRLGDHPRAILTTTPLPLKAVKEMLTDRRVMVRRSVTDDNAANLAPNMLAELHKKYDGTRLGRQELGGELLDDVPGALWRIAWIESTRLKELPQTVTLVRIVVAVDPAVSMGEDADETGIIVVGLGDDGDLYVLEDASGRYSPAEAMDHVISCYDRWEANAVVLETNNGGAYIPTVLAERLERQGRSARSIRTELVHAKKGKRVRAEPVSALYEPHTQTGAPGRVHHIGAFPTLEDQQTTWQSSANESPDRLDALCYGCLYLDDTGSGSAIHQMGSVTTASSGTRVQIPTGPGRGGR